jgi:hypothetical protein
MTFFQESVAARNARLNALNTELGTGAILKLFSGALPANCAAADPSGVLCTITLTGSAFASASSGSMSMTGTWAGTGGGAGVPGNAACFRIYDSGGTTCHQQGDAGTSGTSMILSNANIASGQAVSVTSYTITAGNS